MVRTSKVGCPKAVWPQFNGLNGCYAIVSTNRWNDTPFWIMRVSKHIVPNHTDVFQEGLFDLLGSILRKYAGPSSGGTSLSFH